MWNVVGVKASASCSSFRLRMDSLPPYARSAGQIGFAAAGGTQQNDVVVLLDAVADTELQQLLLLQPSAGQILHILKASPGSKKAAWRIVF